MDYKKAYLETLEQLYFKTRELDEKSRTEEKTIYVLERLKTIITTFDSGVESMEGKRKENAINTLKSLYFVFNHIGRIYLDELAARKKMFKLEKENYDLKIQINELCTQLTTTI